MCDEKLNCKCPKGKEQNFCGCECHKSIEDVIVLSNKELKQLNKLGQISVLNNEAHEIILRKE